MAGALALARPGAPAAAGRVPVVVESGLASWVGRGENAGRLLRHAAVVRELDRLGPVGAGGTFGTSPELKLRADWQRSNLRAVALVQETASRRIVGVAEE